MRHWRTGKVYDAWDYGDRALPIGANGMPSLGPADECPLEKLKAAMSLFVALYNYVRVHQTLKTTPAVAHGIALNPWTLEELLKLSAAA